MKVIRAEYAGFCWGVTRGVALAEEAADKSDGPVFTYGPLIHNPSVIRNLEDKGVHQCDVNDMSTIPDHARVILRAHGVPPYVENELRDMGCEIINGTCPHVVRIEEKVADAHKANRHVVILGDKGHAEVDALVGYAGGDATVVNSDAAVADVPAHTSLTVVAQSTLDASSFERWTQMLHARCSDLVIHSTRCDATEKRQNAAVELCARVDCMVVIGGKASANTRRLAEICRAQGLPAYHVEDAQECGEITWEEVTTVGVTAGASTPEWLISEVIDYLVRQ